MEPSSQESEQWISMQAYTLEHQRPVKEETPLPVVEEHDAFVVMQDYALRDVRPPERQIDERAFLPPSIRDAPPPPEPPPEQCQTVFTALAEVYAVTSLQESLVHRTLQGLSDQCQDEATQGARSQESANACCDALAEVSTRYAAAADEICEWYLANYFRNFYNPEECA
uniref:Uncharacterized protein n=1 Tax=Magnetococcus massalia (strain MO-1) TaxID=451514 RepID=A0A1S7LEH5_MAGMO|nr:Conserved protein of unknown function [Candidatus Magnetococcus massalia]